MTTEPHRPPTPGQTLRALMNRGVVAAPGAFNALVARAVAQAGFDACYVSGGATSVAAGVPDVGILTLDHFTAMVRQVAGSAIRHDGSRIPVLADADTGFGEEEMVRRTVLEYAHAGAAGLHLEDQVFPKRCGHLDGKACIPAEQMVSKIEWAAKAAKDSADPDFVVCARTDAVGVEGFDAAIERAKAYVAAGASMIFPEGLRTEDEFARFAEAMGGSASGGSASGGSALGGSALRADTSDCSSRHVGSESRPTQQGTRHVGSESRPTRTGPYLLANMTEFGKTPILPLERFGAMGYSIVIYPVTTLRVAMGAITRALATLREAGTVEPFLSEMQTREELYAAIGYKPGTPWELPG